MIPLDLPSDGSLGSVDLPSDGGMTQVAFSLPGAPYFMLITQPSGATGIPAQPGSSIHPILPTTLREEEPTPAPGGLPTYKGGPGQDGGGGVVED